MIKEDNQEYCILGNRVRWLILCVSLWVKYYSRCFAEGFSVVFVELTFKSVDIKESRLFSIMWWDSIISERS